MFTQQNVTIVGVSLVLHFRFVWKHCVCKILWC